MKKVLIINQHTCNHGDESAGIALIRKIKETHNNCKIDILYNWYDELNPEAHIGKESLKDVDHYHFPINKLDKLILRLTAAMPNLANVFMIFSKTLRRQSKLIGNYDLVVNGPTGINLGPYQDWYYLWRLITVKNRKKKLAIYSISFGPLDIVSPIFRKRALEVLKYASFLSLRDEKSQSYANKYSIPFHHAIDTTYLFKKKESIPAEYKDLLDKKYVVIVPNELYRWHTYFKKIDKKKMDGFYSSIIEHIINQEDMHIVLLPQMFADENDKGYMQRLANGMNQNKITVIDDMYSSDIQQEIIANSEFVIGARYHTIVFSINNFVPFFALSYEHKIENMLSILQLQDFNFDLLSYFELNKSHDEFLGGLVKSLKERQDNAERIKAANTKAIDLANSTFEAFKPNLD